MAHKITHDYNQLGKSETFNNFTYNIIDTGLYSSITLTRISDIEISASAFTAHINDSIKELSVRIENTVTETGIVVDSTNNLVVARLTWTNSTANDFYIMGINSVDLKSTDIILGYCNFSGTTLVDFDYSWNTIAGEDTNFKVTTSRPLAASVEITAGTAIINGTYVSYAGGTLAVSNTTLGRNDLIGIDSSGTAQLITGVDAGSPVLPTSNPSYLIIAKIERGASKTTVKDVDITNYSITRQSSDCNINGLTEKISVANSDTLIINDSASSYVPKKISASLLKYANNYYSTAGIYYDSSAINIYPYYIVANGTLYSNASSETITAVGSLAASTWYAVVMAESDGQLYSADLSGFDNLVISGNQLNLLSIFSSQYGYCRDSVSGTYYRLLGIYKTNSTPDGVDWIINIPNIPKTYVQCTSNAGQSISTTTNTIMNFEDIDIDTLSEITTGAAWKFTALNSKVININARVRHASVSVASGPPASPSYGDVVNYKLAKNGGTPVTCDIFTVQGDSGDSYALNVYNIINQDLDLDEGDYFDTQVYNNGFSNAADGSHTMATTAGANKITITEVI